MYSEEQAFQLEELGYIVIEKHCLGLCGECMCGSTCLVNGDTLLAEGEIEELIEELTKQSKERVEI